MKKFLVIIFLIFLVENIFLFSPKIKSLVLKKEKSQIVRGWEKAERLGCFSCHGPRGFGATPNPKSKDGEVPSFRGREPMMYAKNDKELREFILYGDKKDADDDKKRKREKKKEKRKEAEKEQSEKSKDKIPVRGNVNLKKVETDKKGEGIIKMPAFKKLVSKHDVDDLVVFIKANAVMINPNDKKLKKGRDIVLKNGCFACHGPLGAGGINDPGSFKGYIPSLIGDDYDELVKSKEELVEWIKRGKIKRFENHFLARIFLKRQIIKMPAYKKVLQQKDIDMVVAYLEWLRKEGKKYR